MSGREVASGSSGGTEPEPKRRRLLDAGGPIGMYVRVLPIGGPIEDDETARRKMRDARVYARGVDRARGEYDGFDPDNVGDVKILNRTTFKTDRIKPVGYFAREGDLPMMRWLYVNGADTRDVDVDFWFPMYTAAVFGRLDMCKWLFGHGAAKDVKRRTCIGEHAARSPLCSTFQSNAKQHVSKWLILSGALCKDDDSGELDVEIMRQDLGSQYRIVREREALLEWANDLHRPRTSFLLFLSGARSTPRHAYRTRRSSSPVRILSGKPGVLELIGDYVGFVRGREARIIRQLTELLPDVNKELDSK